MRPCSTATSSSSALCSAVTVLPSAPSLLAILTTESVIFSKPAAKSAAVPAPAAVFRSFRRATTYLSGPSRRAANTRSSIVDDALTGAPASSLALFAALSAAPFSRKSSCARTAAIAFVACEATFATLAFLSRSAAAFRSSRRSASGLSPASAATIMAVTPSPAMPNLGRSTRVPKVAKSGGESQSPARRPGGPAARAHLPLNPPLTSHNGIAKNLSPRRA